MISIKLEKISSTHCTSRVFSDGSSTSLSPTAALSSFRLVSTGGDGIVLFGGPDYNPEDGGGGSTGIGVNTFIWRASLDTLSFLPLTSADPFGGVIITDWYTPPQTPNERFKISAFILDRAMRADGVRVAVFRQEQGANGWVDAAVADSMSTDLENAILRRARLLRIRTLANQE